ncbi:aspartic proteinase 36 isoform X2 [Nicotiana tomentosiformis]|uniref:Aspartic proteinase-like protein 2 isoform X2 n=1 Tax=Nicotiana tabacum TaxID=4097 RepID=A0A1S4D3U3_TOBAC|nr:aspartic proteinase-like protein 2 isoform X2 [Nicotiana tomentosiformis]XP_016508110.1 PREDICTED: aspartic proteinase-like protein 2 isoform X2 [Nicotiana tabacum]
MMSPVVYLVFVCVFLPATATAVVSDGMTMTLPLERAFPTSHGVEVSQLKARDRVRHGRILQSSYGVVDFPVEGTYDPFLVGLYFTRVQLGSPPKEFYVQIDTGSDVLWVSCASCNGCPTSSGLQIQLDFFDPSTSSTARPISCSDQRCALGEQSSDSGCSTQNQCSYTFQYGDGSGTSGYYVADFMHFDTIVGNSLTSNSSAPVVFGCSTSQTGDLTKPDRAIDGIFGFGQQGLSVIAQLSSQRVTPNVFSHCLKGSNGGGGILVLGQIVEPNLVYTPLVPSQPHYNLNLQSIALNGQTMPISPEVFETSSNRGTIVDSGTTLAYLAEEAYDPFINAINQAVSQNVRPLVTKGNQCYLTTSSVGDIFPTVSLTFAGGATMVLRAADYLIQQNSIGGAAVWCMGFQKIPGQGLTILGDLVLKDKIIVYDLAGQRIGWANYDCSQAVNVSSTTSRGKTEYVNAGQIGNNSSPRIDSYKLLLSFILTSVLHVLVRGTNSVL